MLVDTHVLIDAGRGMGEALTCLGEIERRDVLAVSVVTQMELMVGCRRTFVPSHGSCAGSSSST